MKHHSIFLIFQQFMELVEYVFILLKSTQSPNRNTKQKWTHGTNNVLESIRPFDSFVSYVELCEQGCSLFSLFLLVIPFNILLFV